MFNKARDVVNKTEAILLGKRIAKDHKCSESEDWLQCLRGLDAKEFNKYSDPVTYPVFETEFLPISAQKAFVSKKYNSDVDIMAGIASTEGSMLSYLVLQIKDKITLDDFIEYTKQTDALYHGFDIKRVDDYYLQNVDKNSSLELKKAFYQLFGDMIMKCPTYLFAKQVATTAQPDHNVYFYQVTYQNKYTAHTMGCDKEGMGICHCAEAPFVSGWPFVIPDAYSDIDAIFSSDLMKMWTNFAKYGKPTLSIVLFFVTIILPPLSKGLFKRAIIESGAHMYNKDRDIVSKDESILLGKRIAKEQNCSESEDWLQCLRGLDAKVFNKYD
ncbi:unnamed protein product [Medioppia subpectinata]|uniref:Carboxylesterase type B domain-containing protein n=1 Tax=Medioppia subpectinata TaxID=1979941 RepID=A0A7R9KDK0_9ACAR|nr:unnamed protein product [Medioppia subpectinata]CAG2101306.1 unnamed protein product [Medioppia subpectinata]